MAFNESRLLDCVAYGSQFGMEFNTRIIRLRSGQERRNANWSLPLGKGAVLYKALTPADHRLVRNAYMASLGPAIGFRFKDWSDYQATSEPIGTGTGSSQALQLTRTYTFGSISLVRPIKKPVSPVTIYAAGVPVSASIDYTTGVATLTAVPGDAITWSGQFDVPVRFVSDRLDCEPLAPSGTGFLLSSDVEITEIRL